MYEDCVLQSMRFPQKLWRIVNECENGAIQWGANGDTILLDYKKFQTEYLDTHRPIFKTNNITSFIRQLNLYGFRKVTFHNRDSIYNLYNSHLHEFLHDNFRADRIDLLSKVCRKTGGKGKCFQHDTMKSIESSSLPEINYVSRLRQCQLALTKTLEQISQEHRQKNEEKSIMEKNSFFNKRIRSFENTDLHEVEFSNIPNQSLAMEQNTKYSTFFLSKIDTSSKRKTSPSYCYNKYCLYFNFRNH